MDDRTNEDQARGRWMMINLHRIAGVAMVLVGILTVQHVIDLPEVAGYVLIAVGLFDIFAVPQILARAWRTPPQ